MYVSNVIVFLSLATLVVALILPMRAIIVAAIVIQFKHGYAMGAFRRENKLVVL